MCVCVRVCACVCMRPATVIITMHCGGVTLWRDDVCGGVYALLL